MHPLTNCATICATAEERSEAEVINSSWRRMISCAEPGGQVIWTKQIGKCSTSCPEDWRTPGRATPPGCCDVFEGAEEGEMNNCRLVRQQPQVALQHLLRGVIPPPASKTPRSASMACHRPSDGPQTYCPMTAEINKAPKPPSMRKKADFACFQLSAT